MTYWFYISFLGLLKQIAQTGWLTQDILFPYNLEARGPRSRRSRLVSFWSLSPWLADGSPLPLSSHGLPSLLLSSYKYASLIGLGPTDITSFYFKYLFKGHISKYSHSKVLEFKTSTYGFQGDTIQPITNSNILWVILRRNRFSNRICYLRQYWYFCL